jgi:acetyltransferase-like isoleucine patch superfamily enzyme
MKRLLSRIFHQISSRQLLANLYRKLVIEWFTLFQGNIILWIYTFVYPNIKLGQGINCWGRVIIRLNDSSKLTIGENAHIVSDSIRAGITLFSQVKITAFFDSKISIGNNVGLNGTTISCRTTHINIDDGTMIAPNVIIVDSDFHSLWPAEERMWNPGFENDRGVNIGKNVWIGINCIVLKGVTIGDNSVIGAGSIVNRDIPANTMAAGNPAVVIKNLTDD